MRRHGWTLLRWDAFASTWDALVADVVQRKAQDPEGYRDHPSTRFLKRLSDVVLNEIPSSPSHERYQLGTTLGNDAKFWRRAKFNQRFRLYFRYRSDGKVIVYAWPNDEETLRKAGGKSDPYTVFRAMLERGKPPSSWQELIEASTVWPSDSADASRHPRFGADSSCYLRTSSTSATTGWCSDGYPDSTRAPRTRNASDTNT